MDMTHTRIKLPEEIAARSGYKEAIVAVAEDFTDRARYKCENTHEQCPLLGKPFKKRVIAVITGSGEKIPYEKLDEPVRTVLDEVRGKLKMCFAHLMRAHQEMKL